MKIKINVTKDLKRELKLLAANDDVERIDYIYNLIASYIKKKEAVWIEKIDNVIEVSEKNEIAGEEKAKQNMQKTTKKLQPIILNVDERTFYALAIIAKKGKKTKEQLIINLLANVVNDGKK
jgi:hypothetical protein